MNVERKRRPELERDGPIRDRTNARDSAQPTASEADSERDSTEKSVGNAYEVIERYMREGQRIASSLGDAYSELDLGDNLREMQARWFELSGELLANWFDLVGASSDNALVPIRKKKSAGEPDVEYELECRRRARISAHFSAGAQRFEISGGRCLSEDSDSPGIKWRAITTHESDRILVRAKVKTRQPPGCYHANAINAKTGEILGRITIEVL